MINDHSTQPEKNDSPVINANGANPPETPDPRVKLVEFPSGALANLVAVQTQLSGDSAVVGVSRQALDEVLAWVALYGPHELTPDPNGGSIGMGIKTGAFRELFIGGSPDFDFVDLVRLNGRVFVPEVETVAEEEPFDPNHNALASAVLGVLKRVAAQFRDYQAHHEAEAKTLWDRDRVVDGGRTLKAERNREMAELCENAIDAMIEGRSDVGEVEP